MQRGSRINRALDYWIGIPILNLVAPLKHLKLKHFKRRGFPRNPQKIGIMGSPALGDTLLLSAVLQDVRACWPRAEIVFFCMRQNLAAAELLAGANRRVLIKLTDPLATLRQFRQEKLDALLDFTSWQRLTAFYSLTAGAGFTAGFRTAGQHRGRGYDLAVEHRNDRHEVDNFRAILHALAIPVAAEPAVSMPPAASLEPWTDKADLLVFHPLIVFHLWASGLRNGLREWPEENWLALAKRLAQPGTLFLVTGSPADLPRTRPFVERLRAAGLNADSFTGSDGFRSLARLLRRARVVVSVNTGVMHLAAILGVPTVSLNGPTNGLRWGPVGRCVANVAPADGSGGYLNLGFEYEGQPADLMQKISVEQVTAAVVSLLEECGA